MSEKMEKALSLLTTKYQKTLKALDDKPKEKIGQMSEKIIFTNEQLVAAAEHAKKRGMTLEEYIEEAVHLLRESKEK